VIEAIRVSLARIEASAAAREKLERYAQLFLERNAAMNLSAARDPEAVAAHVRDSLTIAPYVTGELVDVGSGGGFPAVPLAIVTGCRATLIESTAKKARFLTEVATALELPIVVRAERAEDAARDPQLRARFATATARAVGSVPAVLELTVPFLSVGGLAVLQRGRLEDREREAAVDAALVLGASIEGEVLLEADAPADGRRVLLVRKIAATGSRFPRRAGIPAKRPLCYEESLDA
jgi:16S rRNA (guanine527-N7)-methyltransferase